jgi:hypothetical protein
MPAPQAPRKTGKRTPQVIKTFLSYLTLASVEKNVSYLDKALAMVKAKQIWSKSFIVTLAKRYKKLGASIPSELSSPTVKTEVDKKTPVDQVVDAMVEYVSKTVSDPESLESSSDATSARASSKELLNNVVEAAVDSVTGSSSSTALVVYLRREILDDWASAVDEETEGCQAQQPAAASGGAGNELVLAAKSLYASVSKSAAASGGASEDALALVNG